MTIRRSILAGIALLAVTACATRAHLVPGSDMAIPRQENPFVAALLGACVETQSSVPGHTGVEVRHCKPVRADSAREPATGTRPKSTQP